MNITDNNMSDAGCYKFGNTELDLVLRIKISMDSLGILMCLVVLAAIILSKAYRRLVFRLVFYFILADIFQAITHILELTPIEQVNGVVVVKQGAEGLCAFYGFLDQIALWMCNVAIIWIMLYMLWIVNKLRRVQRGANSTNHKISIKAELVGLFFLVFFPLTFNWIPFVWNMYGISGLWCWIKESRGYCEDYELGLTLIFTLFYAPLIIIVTFSFISLVAIATILCNGLINRSAVARSTYSRCVKNTILIAIYPLVYNLICVLPITNRIYSASNGSKGGKPFFPLWMAHTLAEPARVLLPPIAFLLHPSSWKTMLRSRNSKIESSPTPPIYIQPEDSADIDTHIAISTSDSSPKIELYGTILVLPKERSASNSKCD